MSLESDTSKRIKDKPSRKKSQASFCRCCAMLRDAARCCHVLSCASNQIREVRKQRAEIRQMQKNFTLANGRSKQASDLWLGKKIWWSCGDWPRETEDPKLYASYMLQLPRHVWRSTNQVRNESRSRTSIKYQYGCDEMRVVKFGVILSLLASCSDGMQY